MDQEQCVAAIAFFIFHFSFFIFQMPALIFSAPSGSGKSTIINHLMSHPELRLHFSVSATNRPPRGQERDGVEYFFLSPEAFQERIAQGAFIEYEEVYAGRFYGTLKSEVEARLSKGDNLVFDVDVNGATRLKSYFGQRALSIFIQPPGIEELHRRLIKRGTDTPDVIEQRLQRAAYELTFADRFDRTILNDDLARAQSEALAIVQGFITGTCG